MKTVHENRKDFECEICFKGFGHKGSLNINTFIIHYTMCME